MVSFRTKKKLCGCGGWGGEGSSIVDSLVAVSCFGTANSSQSSKGSHAKDIILSDIQTIILYNVLILDLCDEVEATKCQQ